MSLVTIRSAWDRFFFAEDRPDALALMRVCLCAALLIPVASRWSHAREFYSTDGAATPLSAWYPLSAPLPIPDGNLAVMAYTILVCCLITGLIGWKTRTSLAIAGVLLIGFGLLDCTSTLTKYTVIATHGLLILAASNCGTVWSADAWLRGDVSRSVRTTAWPTRLLQLFLAILYFATAVTKVKTPEYMTGEHTIFWMQTDLNWAHPIGQWLSTRPEWVIASSYIVLLWEVLFCTLIWNRVCRGPLIALGILFHAATYFLLGLAIFPLVMLSFYPVFLSSERARAVWLWGYRHCTGAWNNGPVAWPRHAWAFPLVLGLVTVTAVEAEYHIDPMGLRAEKPALPTLDASVAQTLLEENHPDRPADWVWRVDLGGQTRAGVVQTADVFAPNDSPILQIWSHKSHPDMYLHVDVVNDAENVVMQDGIVVPRTTLRSTMPFALAGQLTPGAYAFVIRDDENMIARRPFVVR